MFRSRSHFRVPTLKIGPVIIFVVGIDEGQAKALGETSPDGALAGAHQANEGHGAGHRKGWWGDHGWNETMDVAHSVPCFKRAAIAASAEDG